MFHQISGWFLILMGGGDNIIPPGTAILTENSVVLFTEDNHPLLTEN